MLCLMYSSLPVQYDVDHDEKGEERQETLQAYEVPSVR